MERCSQWGPGLQLEQLGPQLAPVLGLPRQMEMQAVDSEREPVAEPELVGPERSWLSRLGLRLGLRLNWSLSCQGRKGRSFLRGRCWLLSGRCRRDG